MALEHMIKPIYSDARPTGFQQSRCGGISLAMQLFLTGQVLPLPRCSAEPHIFTCIPSVMTGLPRQLQLPSLSVQHQGLSSLTFAFPPSSTLDSAASGTSVLANVAGRSWGVRNHHHSMCISK